MQDAPSAWEAKRRYEPATTLAPGLRASLRCGRPKRGGQLWRSADHVLTQLCEMHVAFARFAVILSSIAQA